MQDVESTGMIAVIGGSGEIGLWLVQRLARQGEDLRVIHRGALSPHVARFPLDSRRADLRDALSMAAVS
jgi:uncharacterized protein YbjT (DUF2867 family)